MAKGGKGGYGNFVVRQCLTFNILHIEKKFREENWTTRRRKGIRIETEDDC